MARDLKEQITDILLSALQPALEKLDPESQKSAVSPSSASRDPQRKAYMYLHHQPRGDLQRLNIQPDLQIVMLNI